MVAAGAWDPPSGKQVGDQGPPGNRKAVNPRVSGGEESSSHGTLELWVLQGGLITY